ncbi:MAG: hypothetical protein AUJ92_00435 [Armatimonadetes bacterium CG2_30_59_28]|nr:Gfo/Idh/MocA family oxidoreductase [Armatimonadota bacterium]OIO98969.1 MAG: hypothetical protein AUJ92_00435 [Armatimonadetes bacterium CG2_30_59_28]PIU66155.1 MAG: hypothetical protein COS85_05975 [Armatimonadetes bacterium CG07_land_8_20_14_0_80_59_28]PIY39842.1 MAG: hypothetical protein COZ05_18655 [Armatimonadetes bacterium CG_4_10_14_3_um_filter_59_10]PJB61912.1 MAG: hypothetical protein CO095_19740 [Armatimonadetes bacterium CG_4_9_14_3_um_filter_58_7]
MGSKVNPVRMGMIGMGNWAREALVPAIKDLPMAEVIAVAARSEASRATALEHFPKTTTYAAAHDLIADDRVEAVIIAAPSALHAQCIEDALKANKHVFLEPPVGMSGGEVHHALELAERSDRVFHADYELRYAPVVAAMQRALQEGAIGKLLMAQVELSSNWGQGGDVGYAAEEGFFSWAGSWYLDLLDACIGRECTSAEVLGGHANNGDLMDHGWALLEYPDGILGQFAFNIVSPHDLRIGVRLAGMEGEMQADLLTGRLRQRRVGDESVTGAIHQAAQPVCGFVGVRESVRAFLSAVGGGTSTQTGVEVCRRVYQTVEMCHRAAGRRREG